MRCSKCGAENPSGKKFCGDCGAPLANLCPKCRADNPADKRFCGECGTALGASATVASANKSDASPIRVADALAAETLEGERKTVTALFADIKGSTELIERLDPEEARAIIDPVLRLMMDAVHRYGGYIAQSTGDGIFALFGAPLAYEDHPQRALHAALAMQQAIHERAARCGMLGRPGIEARVGISTGEVVVRTIETGGHPEYAPIGLAANLASRLQTVAAPGSIAVSAEICRVCEGYFSFRALGPSALKGIAEPVEAYEVTGLGPLRSHFELSARRGLTRFVGREHELAALHRMLIQALSGHGEVLAVVAEAGTGKSRLFHEFKSSLPIECRLLQAYSVSHGKASAWLPVLELLHRYFGIEATNDPVARREKVQAGLTALGIGLTDVRPYLFALFGITDEPDPLAQMNSQVKRRRTLEAIRSVILRESLKQPLVIVFEDLHWVDGETQELLDLLVESITGTRILLLVNYRPEYRHQWSSKSHYTQIRLDPLGGEGAAAMLTALLGDGAELGTIKRLIAERTGGNPFFIEEMVQALFDEGALLRNGAVKVVRPLSQLRMPPTVQGILASRIDRLAAEQKDLLQTLAVMGRESPLGLIRKVVAKAEAQLEPMLCGLRAAEFIYEQPALTGPEYVFKHALTQEVAYQSILAERRKKIHERVGAAIEELYRDQLEEHLAKLAHHYQRSPDKEKAVTYLKRAADQAAQRCSIVEAEAQYRDAISILKKLLPAPKRDRIELGVQLGLTAVLIGKSFGASEREKPLVRAAELSDRVGDQGELLGLLFQLGQFYIERLRLNETRKLAERAIALAQGIPDQIQEGGAWYNLAESLFWSGDLLTAKTRSEKAWEMLEAVPPELLVSLFGFDLWLLNAWLLGAVELLLGRSDRSLDWENRLLERAGSSSHVFSKAIGIFVASWTASLRREFGKASVLARTARTLSEEHGFSEVLSWTTGVEGYARFWQGERKIGISQQKRAIEGLEAVGSRNQASWRMASLAEAQLHLGELEAAESSLERAFAIVTAGDGWAEPEVHRIAAEVILHKPGGEVLSAQQRFEVAIARARKQSSKWWELRATVGLARTLAKQGRRDEACTMLAEIYGWFTEGFDTADLEDAKALLDELRS